MLSNKKFWLAWIVLVIAMNAYDFVVHGMIIKNMYYMNLPNLFYPMGESPYSIAWLFIVDAIAAFVFLWFYDAVGRGIGGWKFGLYAGIFISFPAQVSTVLFLKGFPYGLGWAWTFAYIGVYVVAGLIAGALYKKDSAPAT